MYIDVRVYRSIYIETERYVRIHVYVYKLYMHIYMYIHIYIYLYTYLHICIYILKHSYVPTYNHTGQIRADFSAKGN